MDGRQGSQKACGAMICGDLHSLCFNVFFWKAFFLIFCDVGSILGGFWEAKMEAKIDFWEVFFRCIFRVRFGIEF